MMKKALASVLALLLIACMALTACGGSTTTDTTAAAETTKAAAETTAAAGETTAETTAAGETEARLVKGCYSGITISFEPFETADFSVTTSLVMDNCYGSLTMLSAEHEIVPNVCDKWEMSEDGKTYTFHINPNATFSDGNKITAEDVAFSYEKARVSTKRGHNWEAVTTVEAVDAENVKFTLSYPDALFLNRTTGTNNAAIVEKSVFEELGADYGMDHTKAVYSGAYIVTEWEPNVSCTLKARDDYWNALPEVKDVQIYSITDTNGMVVAVQTGDIDFSYTAVSGSSYDTLKQAEGVHFTEVTSARFENINFYHRSGMFSDLKMRQAVAYAVNPEDALAVGIDGHGFVTRYPYDVEKQEPAIDYTSPNQIVRDVEKAKALVNECGNAGKHVVIASYQPDPYPALSTWLQSVLVEIGLDAEVQVMERSAWLDACNAEELTISILSLNGNNYDLDGMINYMGAQYFGTRGNYGWYESEEMEALITEARNTVGDARGPVFQKMIDLMWSDVVLVPLFGWINSLPVRDGLVIPDGLNYHFETYRFE